MPGTTFPCASCTTKAACRKAKKCKKKMAKSPNPARRSSTAVKKKPTKNPRSVRPSQRNGY